MLKQEVLESLKAIVGQINVFTAKEDMHCYATDSTLGIKSVYPGAVVKPGSAEEISKILQLANKEGFSVVPRGAGTSLCGGVMPLEGAVVLEVNRMNKILEIDEANLLAVVEPGVITSHLHQAVEKKGLFFPPDPGSMNFSTIGGNVAVGAGGLRGLKYGTIKHYVLGMEVVMPWGAIINTGGRTVKNVTGYDLTSLMVGSEGTLGIITKIIVKLIPFPAHSRSMLAIFNELNDAAKTVAAIIKNKIIPATLDIMDNSVIRSVENVSKLGLPVDAGAILLIDVDGAEQVVEQDIKLIEKICQDHNVKDIQIARNEEEKVQVWLARRNAYGAMNKINNTDLCEDATVPRSRVPEMMQEIVAISEKYGITIATLGHAGDGNMHPNILFDRNDPEQLEKVEKAVEEIFKAALRLGGTLSGEHGIGIGKKRFMELELGKDGIETLSRIKRALDPNNILNPGKIID